MGKIVYIMKMQWKKIRGNAKPLARFGFCLFLCCACLFIMFSVLRNMMEARGFVGYVDVIFDRPMSLTEIEKAFDANGIRPDNANYYTPFDVAQPIALCGAYRGLHDTYGESLDQSAAYRDANVCWLDIHLIPDEYLLNFQDFGIKINEIPTQVVGRLSAWIPDMILENNRKSDEAVHFSDKDGARLIVKTDGDLSDDDQFDDGLPADARFVVTVPSSFFHRNHIPITAMSLCYLDGTKFIQKARQAFRPYAGTIDDNGGDYAATLFDGGVSEGLICLFSIVTALLCLTGLYEGWMRTYDKLYQSLYIVGFSRSSIFVSAFLYSALVLLLMLVFGNFCYALMLIWGEPRNWMKPLEFQHILFIYCLVLTVMLGAHCLVLLNKMKRLKKGEKV